MLLPHTPFIFDRHGNIDDSDNNNRYSDEDADFDALSTEMSELQDKIDAVDGLGAGDGSADGDRIVGDARRDRVEDDPQVRALLDAETPVVCLVAKSDIRHVREALRTTLDELLQRGAVMEADLAEMRAEVERMKGLIGPASMPRSASPQPHWKMTTTTP